MGVLQMKTVLGIDPGVNGAFALLMPPVAAGGPFTEDQPRSVVMYDMPVAIIKVGGKERRRVDGFGLLTLVDEIMSVYNPDAVVIEQVAGQKAQAAASGFEFGYGVATLHQTFRALGVQFEIVPPSVWKKAMKVPAEKKFAVARADELMPDLREAWRVAHKTQKKAPPVVRPDRAEAALLALWASQQ